MTMAISSMPALDSSATIGGVNAGYGISLTDLSGFQNALSRAQVGEMSMLQPQQVKSGNETMQAIFKPLEDINAEAASLHKHAEAAMAAGTEMTPGEMVMLTVRAQEFLFHSQLTANVANRTSDGLQQLFRQQA